MKIAIVASRCSDSQRREAGFWNLLPHLPSQKGLGKTEPFIYYCIGRCEWLPPRGSLMYQQLQIWLKLLGALRPFFWAQWNEQLSFLCHEIDGNNRSCCPRQWAGWQGLIQSYTMWTKGLPDCKCRGKGIVWQTVCERAKKQKQNTQQKASMQQEKQPRAWLTGSKGTELTEVLNVLERQVWGDFRAKKRPATVCFYCAQETRTLCVHSF